MKSSFLSIIVTCLLFVNANYAQEKPFEGTIRFAVSLDFDQLTKNMTNTGNKLADKMMKKKIDGTDGDGTAEVLSNLHGQYEYLMQVKGNKLAMFNTQDGTLVLSDCDKGEIFITYPFAKLCLKYTVTDYQQMTSAIKYDITILHDSIKELGGYHCKKVIKSGKMNGKEVFYSESWFTDKITLPSCYLETFHDQGLAVVSEINVNGDPIYSIVTESNRIQVSDENFIIPKEYEILTKEDSSKFSKKLGDAAKNKKTYTVGSKIPEVFWDY